MTAVLHHRWLVVALGMIVASSSLCGAEKASLVLTTISGEEHRGSLVELRDSWTLRFLGKARVRCEAEEWIALRQANRPLPGWPTGPHLILSNGDRISVSSGDFGIANDQLRFRHAVLADGKETRLGLPVVAAIFLTTPDTATDPFAFCRRLAGERPRKDVVQLRNGDSLEGVLVALDRFGVRVRIGQKTTPVELGRIAAISFSNLAETKPPLPAVFGRAVLVDGSRLTLRDAACADGESISGTTLVGTPFRVPVNDLASLDLFHSHIVHLSDLKPAKYEHTPYLGVSWPLAVDATVARSALRLGGSVFDRGLGMHSACRVTYALPGAAKRFEARVGLDDAHGLRGSVRIRVLVDGKERDFGEVTHHGGPVEVRIDVAGAKELTLVVDFGANGDIGDYVNWVNARVVCQ